MMSQQPRSTEAFSTGSRSCGLRALILPRCGKCIRGDAKELGPHPWLSQDAEDDADFDSALVAAVMQGVSSRSDGFNTLVIHGRLLRVTRSLVLAACARAIPPGLDVKAKLVLCACRLRRQGCPSV